MSMNCEIIELLQHEMARVVQDGGAGMLADLLEEPLEGHAIVKILAGMDLERDVDAVLVVNVEDRRPAPAKLVERGLDQARRALGPWVEIGPGQSARESDMRPSARDCARPCAASLQLLHRPLPAARSGLPRTSGAAKPSNSRVVGRMHRDQLALEMGRQLGDLQPVLAPGAERPHRNRSWLSAACSRSNSRPSQVGIWTPL